MGYERQLLLPVNEKQHLQTAFAALEPFKIAFFNTFIKNTRCTHSFQLPRWHWDPKPPLVIERPQRCINSSIIFKQLSLLFSPCLSCIFLSLMGVFMCSCLVYWLNCVHSAFCPWIKTGVRTWKTCLRWHIWTCNGWAQTTVWNAIKWH